MRTRNVSALALAGSLSFSWAAAAAAAQDTTSSAPAGQVTAEQDVADDELALQQVEGEVSAEEQAQVAQASSGEIMVTAQRRVESVQRTALSIVALPTESLIARGVVDTQTLNNLVPGLRLSNSSAQVQTFIRGIGDVTGNAFQQPAVAFNTDGVYVARSNAFSPLFFDIARIEVLRGPQGTLYGRNASGGSINVITKSPSLGGIEGFAAAELGNYNLWRGEGAVNVPLSDIAAVRVAGRITRRDGYLTDGSNDDKSEAARIRVLVEPTDTVSINLIAEAAHVGGKGYGRGFRPALFGDPWTGPQDPRITPALFPLLRVRNVNSLEVDYRGASLQLDWDLGFATLTVLPAYRYSYARGDIGADFIFDTTDTSKQKSIETRLSGDTGGLRWVLGAYGYDEDLSSFIINDTRRAVPLSGSYQEQDVDSFDTRSWALFGEATYSITDDLRLIGGARYTDESTTREGEIRNSTFTNGVQGRVTVSPLAGEGQFSAVTWKAGAEYDLSPRNMLFLTASKGFKAGGLNPTDQSSYEPEYLTAYTLGSKNRFFDDNSLTLNLEGFYWKYKDQQVGFLGIDSFGRANFVVRNAGAATIYGASAEINWNPTPNDNLTVGAEWLKATFDEFIYPVVVFGPIPAAGTVQTDGCISRGLAPGTTNQFSNDCSGQPLQRAPEFTLNARYSHTFELGDDGDVVLGITGKYDSLTYLGLNWVSPNFRQEAYELFDLDLTYNSPDRDWSLQFYMRNIEDKAVYQIASNQSSIAPTTGVNRGSVATVGAPRTYGVRAQVNF